MASDPSAGTALASEYFSAGEAATPRSFRTLRELMRKKIAVLAIIYLSLFYIGGLRPAIAPYGLTTKLTSRHLSKPSSDPLFGTNGSERHVYSVAVFGRTTLFTLIIMITGGFSPSGGLLGIPWRME